MRNEELSEEEVRRIKETVKDIPGIEDFGPYGFRIMFPRREGERSVATYTNIYGVKMILDSMEDWAKENIENYEK